MSEVDEVMKTAYEDVKSFCESINAAGGSTNCTIVPASKQWLHTTTCEQSYTPGASPPEVSTPTVEIFAIIN